MSHTGTKILYEIVNRREGFACERSYAPWVDLEEVMRREAIPLFSIESCAPVRDFDVVGFSLQSELNYTNVPNMLDLAGIPVLSADRGDADPVVIGGGPCVANPEPVADFFDVFLIGDAEEALGVFLDAVKATRGLPRRERLLAFAACPGIYVPSLYDVTYDGPDGDGDRVVSYAPNAPGVPERAKRVWVEKLDPSVYPAKPMVPSVDIVQDRLGLEIMRGCTQGCRFCQAGYWYRPVRELDPADVARMTKAFIDEAGWSEVGLLSLSSADYSQIEPLVACLAPELAKTKVSISLPSLRAEAFSVALADAVSEVRKSGFTFAPETGSDRLRRVINKTFTNDDMVKAAGVAFERGWDLIKVYTMIGLPSETTADLDELVTLVANILAEGRKKGVRATVHVSIGSYVPKSFTPFQWSAFDGVERLTEKLVVPEGEVPPRPGSQAEVARAEGGRDRGDALARRPADVEGPPRGLEAGRPVRRLVRALLLGALDRGARGRGDPEGAAPAREGPEGDAPLGRRRRLDPQALPRRRVEEGAPGDGDRRLQVGPLHRLRRPRQRRGHRPRERDAGGVLVRPAVARPRSRRPPAPAPGRPPRARRLRRPRRGARLGLRRQGEGGRLPDEGDTRPPAAPRAAEVPGRGERERGDREDVARLLREARRRPLPLAPQRHGRPRAGAARRARPRPLHRGLQPAHPALDGAGPPARPGVASRALRPRRRRRPRRRSTSPPSTTASLPGCGSSAGPSCPPARAPSARPRPRPSTASRSRTARS